MRLRNFLLFVIISLIIQPAFSEITIKQLHVLKPDSFGENDGFGSAVDISANGFSVISGMPGEGAAQVYQWWNSGEKYWATTLYPETHHPWMAAGNSVCISSNYMTIVVGAKMESGGNYQSGVCFLYQWDGVNWDLSGWEETKLTASDSDNLAHFGADVDCSRDGNTVVVGADQDSEYGEKAGSLYIYQWWEGGGKFWETKLNSSFCSEGDLFGHSVSLSGDGTLILTASYPEESYLGNTGVVYLYRWDENNWDASGWEETYFIPETLNDGDRFGENVAISGVGETLLIGAPGDDTQGVDAGSVYIYDNIDGAWYLEYLLGDEAQAGMEMGISVDLSADGNSAVVGGNGKVLIMKRGSIYDSWQTYWLDAPHESNTNSFGNTVSISDNGKLMVVGDCSKNDYIIDTGSVYIYSIVMD